MWTYMGDFVIFKLRRGKCYPSTWRRVAPELELVDPVISLFEEIRVFQPCACRQAPVLCCRATDA